MKRIVLPTDFSENAWNAIEYALSIFKEAPCEFFVINAFKVGSSGLTTKRAKLNETRLFRILKEESEQGLEKVLKRIKSIDQNPEHTFTTLSIVDSLTNAVGRTVYGKEVDCIIMGTKGATGLKEVFMGSNTYKIIKDINFCPIIAVPEEYKSEGTINTILLATGYEHLYEAYEFKPLIEIAKLFDSKVQITYVGNPEELSPQQKNARDLIKEHLKSVNHKFVDVDSGASVSTTIQDLVENNEKIDMVAMINYWHGFFEKLTREAVIKKISFNTSVPFLVTHLFE
ncbi:universal stress protein [Flagellimonas nanhaiensis]|uniref:Universal stress protein n=1 Tax=Flagellimonas nanhaiensis TaxID=2292706 RepID=A0A371JLU8_9FLAO|nr:universal stress protein [Allomuricauda nanhaiensis]RDY58039.1 universal stress protein [Allomuricauda nanhaiensis]